MWLVDHNIPVGIFSALLRFGKNVQTVSQNGWERLENGKLVSAAYLNGFKVIITKDRLFAEDAARALSNHPDFAVVLVRLPKQIAANQLDQVDWFIDTFQNSPIIPIAGRMIEWPS